MKKTFNILNPRHTDRGNGDGIYRMEFPLMQWLVASFYKMFGNHLIITRIFTFIVGLFSVVGLYKLLLAIFRKDTLALIGAWAFNFSPCFYYYTINPLPDNFALCCSIWGIALFFSWIRSQRPILLILSGIFLCIGSLSKLPFILYYSVPLTYFLVAFIEQKESRKKILIDTCIVTSLIILPLIWYASVVPTWKGNGIVTGLLVNNTPINVTLGYFRYIVISTFPELLLNYNLRSAAPDDALCIAGDDDSHSIFFYFIHKKGWGFSKSLNKQQMSEMVGKGALFLYSDSRTVDEDKEIAPYLDTLIMEKGSIRVYKLKKE